MAVPPQEKNIIEEVSGWLRVFDDGSVDRTWLGPPEVKFMSDPVPAHEEEYINGVATRDLTIDPDSNLRIRIYLPKEHGPDGSGPGSEVPDAQPEDFVLKENTKKLQPTIVHLHGGGFCISQADWFMYYAVYTQLARSAQAIVISVYLHLAPENRLPVAIEDGYRTLLWLGSVARAESHEPWLAARTNFSRVFLIGDSSGGNLVHHVAARAETQRADISPVRLAGAIPIHPGFCRAKRCRSELEMPQTPFLTLDMLDKFISLALPPGSTKDHPFTCPLGPEAPPLEDVEMPPVMLCVAEKDLFVDTEMEYYEAMKKAGKEIVLFVSSGMTHGFYLHRIAVEADPATKAETQKLFEAIVGFINGHQ